MKGKVKADEYLIRGVSLSKCYGSIHRGIEINRDTKRNTNLVRSSVSSSDAMASLVHFATQALFLQTFHNFCRKLE